MNNTRNTVAEFMEGRVSTKGNSQQCARIQTQGWDSTMSRLLAVRKAAKEDKKQQFTNLFHHINEDLLKQSFHQLKRQSAPGCDGVTWTQYAEWLLKFIQHRVLDKRILRLINQWIKVGIIDEHGHRVQAHRGTPAGAVISPLLANIYLHYSFDLWMNEVRKVTQGEVIIVRYADGTPVQA